MFTQFTAERHGQYQDTKLTGRPN